ncbi:hypothetical protein LSPH24S_02354 [Lysinibacillus sphaericus]
MEPYEIARLVEERSGIIQAMDIGILATDESGNVTFINRLARQYTHFFGHKVSRKALFKNTWLAEDTIQQHEIYRPLLMFDQMYLVRTFPNSDYGAKCRISHHVNRPQRSKYACRRINGY